LGIAREQKWLLIHYIIFLKGLEEFLGSGGCSSDVNKGLL